MSEVITAGGAAKSAISEGYQTNGMVGVKSAAAAVKSGTAATSGTGGTGGTAAVNVSKYLATITATDVGQITLTTSSDASLASDAQGKTIVLTPYINGAVLTASTTATGSLEWACTTASQEQAKARGITSPTAGTLPAKYAPSECR